jgi:hypothetical protein
VKGDADDFVRIQHTLPGPSFMPLTFVQKQKIGMAQNGNVVAFYTIGDHPEPAIAHLFKNIHSEVLALERAKTTDSLFVSRKYDI